MLEVPRTSRIVIRPKLEWSRKCTLGHIHILKTGFHLLVLLPSTNINQIVYVVIPDPVYFLVHFL